MDPDYLRCHVMHVRVRGGVFNPTMGHAVRRRGSEGA